jgi:hypothetical protein
MQLKMGPTVLGVAILAAAGLAFMQRPGVAGSSSVVPPSPSALQEPRDLAETTVLPGALPPNHPPLRSSAPSHPDVASARNEAPGITWTQPAAWEVRPSSSAMRLVTYRPRAQSAGAADVEVTITRAGGTPRANLDRWVGQFDGAGADVRAERTVDGVRIETVEVNGIYEGGMTKSGADEPHPGWGLLGAVVETNGLPYFFKLIGPAAAVADARPAFEALLGSIRAVR